MVASRKYPLTLYWRQTMRIKIGLLSVLLVSMSTALVIAGSTASGTDSKGRPEISSGDKALAAIEVQNVFSKHCYYHEAGKHREEMKDLWVKKDGEFAKTAKWTQPRGVNNGYDAIWKFYVIYKEKELAQNLEDISKVDPTIKNLPENLGIGGEWASHTQTTAVIEVAGDGKTAKGVWQSPGLNFYTKVKDGKINKRGAWFWEKYGADFVKEDGKWKIWHINMYYENVPPEWNADTDSYEVSSGAPSDGTSSAPVVEQVASEPTPQAETVQMYSSTNSNPYKAWSPTKLPKIEPRLPEPYYTFSETFSY
jgi:hypothetical protein